MAMEIEEIIKKTNKICSNLFLVISFFSPSSLQDSSIKESDSYKTSLVFPKKFLKKSKKIR